MNADSTVTSFTYQIIVEEYLDSIWSDWFDSFVISQQTDGTTLLEGNVKDQAALHGVLKKISNLGLTLISVNSHSASSCI